MNRRDVVDHLRYVVTLLDNAGATNEATELDNLADKIDREGVE